MTPRAWAVLALVGLLLACGLGYYSGHKNQQIDRAIQQSQELKGKISALQEQARIAVGQADEAAKTAAQHEATAQALKVKLARARQASAGQSAGYPVVPGGVSPAGDTADVVDDLRDQIIAAQDEQIAALKVENTELRTALDLKDQALIISERRARALEIARDARESAIKRNRWLGRLEGLVVGLGAGYVAGRVM